jgi:four helix bundle protein
MRDPAKLEAFHAADELATAVYSATRSFPSTERFGLTMQIRRAAVSIAANIVEGCARPTASDYARHLAIAYSSACEAQYEIGLARRLGYLNGDSGQALLDSATRAAQLTGRLAMSVRKLAENP